jgi:hypothetical protein
MAISVNDVFVVGGLPNVTYVPRDELSLEAQLSDYLSERYRLLSLTGPTKCGKTVLVKRVVPDAVWISGGNVTSADVFWQLLADSLGGYGEEERELTREDAQTDTNEVDAGLRWGLEVGYRGGGATEARDTRRQAFRRQRPAEQVALAQLAKHRDAVLFIDDFHYVAPGVQQTLVRGLKGPIFEGSRVILASVPHRAFDAVRVEKEMTGRIVELPAPIWSGRDLREIATRGFEALKVGVARPVIDRLANESFGSPFLMQDFCLHLCKDNDISESQATRTLLQPKDLDSFFRSRVTAASRDAFELMAQGPRQRTDRKQRQLVDGQTGDIYQVVLEAIAATGPATQLALDDLRKSIRRVLRDEPPRRQEVIRVLDEMAKIARERIEGEPIIDFDRELEVVHITDPFFAFYLRWAA